MKLSRLEILALCIATYMMLALLWWAVLLYQKNEQLYQIKEKLEVLEGNNDGSTLKKELSRQRWMILGEGIFLAISMMIGIFIIVSASRKQLQVQKQQNNFLLSITHELKSPIASVKLILDTLTRRKLDNNQTQQLLSNAKAESNRLEKLVDNLLTSTKLEDGYPYHFEEIDLDSYMIAWVNNYKKASPDQSLKYLPGSLKAYVNLDQQAFGLVLNNLVSNGFRYGGNEVKITRKEDEKNMVILDIVDSGSGVDASFTPYMFDKFRRAQDEETRTHKGTGLGLYLVKQILSDHHGDIDYQNHEESTFTVRLRKR